MIYIFIHATLQSALKYLLAFERCCLDSFFQLEATACLFRSVPAHVLQTLKSLNAFSSYIHRMQIWRATRLAPGTSCMKVRLVRPLCFVLTMLPLKSLTSWTVQSVLFRYAYELPMPKSKSLCSTPTNENNSGTEWRGIQRLPNSSFTETCFIYMPNELRIFQVPFAGSNDHFIASDIIIWSLNARSLLDDLHNELPRFIPLFIHTYILYSLSSQRLFKENNNNNKKYNNNLTLLYLWKYLQLKLINTKKSSFCFPATSVLEPNQEKLTTNGTLGSYFGSLLRRFSYKKGFNSFYDSAVISLKQDATLPSWDPWNLKVNEFTQRRSKHKRSRRTARVKNAVRVRVFQLPAHICH